jgi:hypothetical protein
MLNRRNHGVCQTAVQSIDRLLILSMGSRFRGNDGYFFSALNPSAFIALVIVTALLS